MSDNDIQEIELEYREDREGPGPRLWDADPTVCCAAFQLGACQHTEAWTDEDIADALAWDQTEATDPDEDYDRELAEQAGVSLSGRSWSTEEPF